MIESSRDPPRHRPSANVIGPVWLAAAVIVSAAPPGCASNSRSDTARTATEQLVVSTALDRAIDALDFAPLAGKDVYLDTTYLEDVVDKNYLISSLRQRMFAQGCRLKADKDQAAYVVEARAGAVGTNRHDVLLGIPAVSAGAPVGPLAGVPLSTPEVAFARSTDQKAVAKVGCFAYDQRTGERYWQSGMFPVTVNAKDAWILGAGPLEHGSMREHTRVAGSPGRFWRRKKEPEPPPPKISLSAKAVFEEPPVVRR